jgi:hypothetical protein
MSNKKIYIEELKKIIGSFSFYIWKPVDINDKENNVDYIHFKLISDELTSEHHESIVIAGNLKFVFSINIIVDSKGKKYLFIKTVNLRKLIEMKNFYENKITELNVYLDYVNNKINQYDC